jgi:molecular chaperone Hsp33
VRPDAAARDDLIRPFQVEQAGVRGRLVRLGDTVDTIIRRHAYPWPVARLLGEAIALTSVLAGALRFDGVFSLQAKGDGPVRMLVVDFVSPGALRGYVQYDADLIDQLGDTAQLPQTPVPRLMGAGYLAFTVDQGEEAERYQGIVPLEGATLADCAHKYFRDSEQVQTAIRLAATEVEDGAGDKAWRAGALMVQRLPEGDPALLARGVEIDPEEWAEDWHRAVTHLATARDDELLDATLPADTLLYRLFHEDGVRVFRDIDLDFGCRCSRQRAERVLEALPGPDLEEMTVDGRIIVSCEFCSARYDFEAEAFLSHDHA